MTKTILIIDDDPDILDVAELCLSTLGGFTVLKTHSGEEAIAIAERQRPDALLIDSRMTPLDGAEVLERLRESPATAEIPAIFLTASVQFNQREELERLAVKGVIEKPFDPETLASRVSALLGWQ